MENQEKMTFSLADDDEEVVEEQIIDRDEEYEVDDDEEEEYDDYDDYDDEEEYDDEDYDEEEDYEDDGYNDDYYDDRLNKVLDEIAEIKRGMQAPSTVVQQQQPFVQPPIPQYIYQPQPPVPAAGSEVVMYNEISRLRDELAKNQSSLEMQKELSRIKEDMARDQKFAESQYNAEIKRLQDRIDDLLKNASSPQDEQSSQDAAGLEGDKSLDIDKLLSINEAVLRAMRDTDARIQNEIAQLRKQVEERPSMDDINRALSSVKKAVQNINTSGLNSDIAEKLSDEIAALKDALASGTPAAASAPVVVEGGNGDILASELLRQLYEIKNVIGSSSAAAVKRTQTLCELVNEFKKVNYDVHSQNVGYKDKLTSIVAFAKKLSECNEQDAVDLIQATNALIEELTAAKATREVFADIVAYCQEIDDKSITSAMRDSADKFYNITDKLDDVELDSVVDYISDLVAEKNVIQNNKKEKDNNELLTEITGDLLEDERDDDEIKEKIALLAELKAGEIIELPLIQLPKNYKATHAVDDENIFSKLAELKAAVLDASAKAQVSSAAASDAIAEADNAEEDDFGGEEAVERAVSDDDVAAILDAIDALESKLTATTGANGLSEAIEEVRANYIDIAERLVDISEKIAAAPHDQAQAQTHAQEQMQTQSVESVPASGMTDEEIGKTLDDLDYIRNKLDEHEAFIRQIADLRADVLGMAGTVDNGEQSVFLGERFENIINEIGAQSDKLYEDLSNALIDTENNIVARTAESTVVTDAIADAKSSILADTQAIQESVARLGDALGASPLGGAIDQLHTDILNLSDQAAINNEAAILDRQKLLDDIAYIRGQAEAAQLEKNHAPQDEFDGEKASDELEKLYGYLDDISARIDVLAPVPEDVASTKDNVAAVLDTLLPMSDRLNEIIERMDAVEAQENADAEFVAEQEIQADPLDDDIARLKDDVATILDSLPLLPQSEDVIAARDNTYSILDNISALPQSADIVAIRDNINAILEAVQKQPEGTVAEDVAAIRAALPDGLAEDIALVRDNTALVLDSLASLTQSQEDVQYIRQKLDENNTAEGEDEVNSSLANIMNDIGIVLDKLEAFEQQAVNNKQEIVDTVSGIREEIHINELDENISASGIDDETRDLLVNEIAEIRERLNTIESTTQSINDVNATALDNIFAKLDALQIAVSAQPAQSEDVVVQTLDDVNEKLNLLIDSLQGGSLDAIAADIADIKARLEANGEAIAEDGGEVDSPDSLQAIIDELNEIKEKLDSEPEYDTVEEILSLRDDVKAARIVDQNEVSSELEAIKNELAAISSGSVLDEIRALRDDIAAITGGQVGEESDSAPTDGELNLVLNEIVSLRDEVFALKDEVLNATGNTVPTDEEQLEEVAGGDVVNSILDELGDLRDAQGILTDSIEELKEVISRGATVAPDAYSADGAEAVAAQTGELNVVLDEINNLKSDIDGINGRISNESIDTLSKQIEELRDRIDAFVASPSVEEHIEEGELDDIRERLDNIALNASAVDFAALNDRLDEIGSVVNDLRLERENAELGAAVESGVVSGSLAENFENLRADIEDVKAAIATMAAPAVGDEIAELRAEIENLRAENEALKQSQNDALALELSELKNAIHDMTLSATPTTENGDTSYAALIDEIKSLKEAVATQAQTAPTPFADELGEIRDEIAQLRSLTTVTADQRGGQAEIAALRDELAELKGSIASPDSMFGLAEDVTSIRADVQTLKEEPDLGVMNEILALRDEFQALREQIEDVKRVAAETDKQSDDTILSEVQSLRDQLFAISMANVNDSASGESNYESYNNIILDEIASIRDRINSSGSSDDIKAVTDEIAQLRALIDERESMYEDLANKVSRFDNDATNNKILEELTSLRTELANQRDADLTTLNFMSEMAHLLERQNSYIAQNTGSKITDEIESLKAEIASSDAVAEEVAKLREIMTQSGNASDNDTILGELADLREELSSEKPSRENELILQEISRLRDEITMLAERESVEKKTAAIKKSQNTDELADSLSDLKDQLNEIAGIIEPEQKPKTTRKKSSGAKSGSKSTSKSTSKSGTRTSSSSKSSTTKSTMTKTSSTTKSSSGTTKKSGTSSGTGAKRGRKPAAQKQTPIDAETVTPVQTIITSHEEFTEEDFDAKVDEEIKVLGGDAMSLNPNAPLPSTQDTMDVADKLAQQVANKLVIEQLVEQLGDDGMSEEQVDEILRELPIELTTKALDDQSDRVRKLANQLVLNKLRNRLGGKKPTND